MRRLAAASLALFTLASCGGMRAVETSSESFELEVGAIPNVEVRLEQGRIEALASTSGRVGIEVRKRARGLDRQSARSMLEGLDLDIQEIEGGVRVESRFALSSSPLGGDFGMELVLRVPERCTLDLRTGEGSIEVRQVNGAVSVESGDGRIELDGVSGPMRLRTADGSIRGRELEGSVDARTGDGRIELEGRFGALEATSGDGSIRVRSLASAPVTLAEGWTLRTSDGSIRLSLPSSLSADVEASTLDGSIDAALSGFTGERGERRFRGRLGTGGALILLTTMDGAIRLEESQ